MRIKKLLYGVNAICKQCIKNCKQYKQIVILRCPNFVSVIVKKKKHIASEHKKEC
ncbi:hypothetical protein ACFL2G_05310 [Candidatus Omnitrophota bacterium]